MSSQATSPSLDELVAGIRGGSRAMLARAITLVESRKIEHRRQAQTLLEALLPDTGGAMRVGITGVPGVGKSTFIEALGINLTAEGKSVAVLAVDPSSGRSGGSILGDKTRMERLAADPGAFIRPSPSAGVLGGVARATRETMLLCEAAGFDVVLVETVGAGQSEYGVADMVDTFLVLMLPGAGDELQGIKKGVLEVADILAVNKSDMEPKAVRRAARDYASALHIMTPADAAWKPPVVEVSGLKNEGLARLWEEIEKHRRVMQEAGLFEAKRRSQRVSWMWAMLENALMAAFKDSPKVKAALPDYRRQVEAGEMTASAAAQALIDAFNEGR